MMKRIKLFIFIEFSALLYVAGCNLSGMEEQIYLWDGQESIASYAQRLGFAPRKTIVLGQNISIELVLIPSGRFEMGTDQAESQWIGIGCIAAGAISLIIILIMKRRSAKAGSLRMQWSLRAFMLFIAMIALIEYGGVRLWLRDLDRERYCAWATPKHEVTIAKPFYMGKYEITQEQYEHVVGVNPSHSIGKTLPVHFVTWKEAKKFCRLLTEMTGYNVRLPSEAEWEYACRAGTVSQYSSGDYISDLDKSGWHSGNSNNSNFIIMPHSVGLKQSNNFGLYDMHGNVSEWVEDYFSHDYNITRSDESANERPCIANRGNSAVGIRVLRGGCVRSPSKECRSASRFYKEEDIVIDYEGFRIIVDCE